MEWSSASPDAPFFNHHVVFAEGFWSRRAFLGAWRRLYARDPYWRPPHIETLRRTLGELQPLRVWVEALPKTPFYGGSSFELPVAAAAVRCDPLHPELAYLTMLHLANDRAALRALLEALTERLRVQGVRTLLGPTHLLPHLGGGVLKSHWHLPPPTDTPYAPPYLAEHLNALMSPTSEGQLFHLTNASAPIKVLTRTPTVQLSPFDPTRLAGDLLPLLHAACEDSPALSPPDETEARALLRWLAPSVGLLAAVEGAPVGFALLYPDASARARRIGRPLSADRGRLLGGVLAEFRLEGVGRALLERAQEAARLRGWERLSVGPVLAGGASAAFLRACGGVAEQRYSLYQIAL